MLELRERAVHDRPHVHLVEVEVGEVDLLPQLEPRAVLQRLHRRVDRVLTRVVVDDGDSRARWTGRHELLIRSRRDVVVLGAVPAGEELHLNGIEAVLLVDERIAADHGDPELGTHLRALE
ncbi:MAG: hypothetical protein KIT58_06120 [Planctomycetota bacterium]|nr:hypothetical protein [Planctomycetota bacterium]